MAEVNPDSSGKRPDADCMYEELHFCAKYLQERVRATMPNVKLRLVLECGSDSNRSSRFEEYPEDPDTYGDTASGPALASILKFREYYDLQRDRTNRRLAAHFDDIHARDTSCGHNQLSSHVPREHHQETAAAQGTLFQGAHLGSLGIAHGQPLHVQNNMSHPGDVFMVPRPVQRNAFVPSMMGHPLEPSQATSEHALAQPAVAPTMATTGHGNRSQGSVGTAVQVSTSHAARVSEEAETAAAATAVRPSAGPSACHNTCVDSDDPPVPSRAHLQNFGVNSLNGAEKETSTALAVHQSAFSGDPAVYMEAAQPHQRLLSVRQADGTVAENTAVQKNVRTHVPGVQTQEHAGISRDGLDAATHDTPMHDAGNMLPGTCNNGHRTGKLQNAQDCSMRTRSRSAPAITHQQAESSEELQMPSLDAGARHGASPASRNSRKLQRSTEARKLLSVAGNALSGDADVAAGAATAGRRGESVPCGGVKTRSRAQEEPEEGQGRSHSAQGLSPLHHNQTEQGNVPGSGQHVRIQRRALKGAEPEPESADRLSAPENKDNEKGICNSSHKRSICQSELGVIGGACVISSKRARHPPAQFEMKQMGGQNEPLVLSHEEKMQRQAEVLRTLAIFDKQDTSSKRCRKSHTQALTPNKQQQQRGRSKSAGCAAAEKAGRQQHGRGVAALCDQVSRGKQEGADQDDGLSDGVDMLKLPGVSRLKVPAHAQPVAKPCQAIPSAPAGAQEEASELEVAGPPTVDEIHTKVAGKLEVKNAIAIGSAVGGLNGGRVGAAQVRAQRPDFRKFIRKILDNDPSLGECGSRVLRLKPTLDLDTSFFEIEMVLEALRYNWRVEALYIHNFEHGFCDTQLDTLVSLLSNGRIWACNVGENFLVSGKGWHKFHKSLFDTSLAFTYVSEAHLQRLPDLKVMMRAAIRLNRILSPSREPDVCKHISNMWYNPSGPTARRHYGCASITQHDQCAANAAPLPEVAASRMWEVDSITCTKTVYNEFSEVRDELLKLCPEALRRKALDPRAFEASSRNASRTTSAALGSNQLGQELRTVRVDYRTGSEADARHEDEYKHINDPRKSSFINHPRPLWGERTLAVCMLELPEQVRARLGLSADGGPGCAEASGSHTGTGTAGNGHKESAGNSAHGSGASVSENPHLNDAAGTSVSDGARDVNETQGGAGSSTGAGVLARSSGPVSAATAAAEKEKRAMIRDGNERMKEVVRGVNLLHGGIEAVMTAVGSKDVQARWADPRRIYAFDPHDYGNDVLAWACKAVGGNITARRAAVDGVGELAGQRIDVFLPFFVQWVGATVEGPADGHEDIAVVNFWNGGKAHLRLRHSLITWRISKKQRSLPPGKSLEPHV